MNSSNEQPPRPGKVLYSNLFENQSSEDTIKKLSEGFTAIIKNITRLISDAELLISDNRFSNARFLIATAREEMAKLFILLDMCRLDFSKYESALRCLCRAFYNHILKHAYFQLYKFGHISSMNHAKGIWESETRKWWPSNDPTYGEPDMPHETYFNREMPLYVDYLGYNKMWWKPTNDEDQILFGKGLGLDILSQAKDCFEKIKYTKSLGLFNIDCLIILNDEFRTHYITDQTDKSFIEQIHVKVATRLNNEHKIDLKAYIKSTYHFWPLYHFLTIT